MLLCLACNICQLALNAKYSWGWWECLCQKVFSLWRGDRVAQVRFRSSWIHVFFFLFMFASLMLSSSSSCPFCANEKSIWSEKRSPLLLWVLNLGRYGGARRKVGESPKSVYIVNARGNIRIRRHQPFSVSTLAREQREDTRERRCFKERGLIM